MNNIELRMLDILRELKKEFGILGVKSEFEAEGIRTDEIVKLNEIIYRSDLESYIKIGGCEAIRDIDYTRVIGAKGIMAPMIETPFAMQKFINSIKKVYGNEYKDKDIIINIETKTAFQNLEDILDVSQDILDIVCVGRVDLSSSLNLSREDIDSETVYEYVNNVAKKVKERKKIMAIGGGISLNSLSFLKDLEQHIDRFETRKIIFPKETINKNYNKALKLSMEFEILYLKNKSEYYSRIASEDVDRLKMLEERFSKL